MIKQGQCGVVRRISHVRVYMFRPSSLVRVDLQAIRTLSALYNRRDQLIPGAGTLTVRRT